MFLLSKPGISALVRSACAVSLFRALLQASCVKLLQSSVLNNLMGWWFHCKILSMNWGVKVLNSFPVVLSSVYSSTVSSFQWT